MGFNSGFKGLSTVTSYANTLCLFRRNISTKKSIDRSNKSSRTAM